ncbi:MAG: spermine synthase [Verrucomicrobiales bacterium]|nr:spermine synthase [Verrucomicrobiota bacterium JB025]
MKPTTTLATHTTDDGSKLVLQSHDGHHYLRIDGVQLMSTTASSSEQQMAEIACQLVPAKPRVLIGGLGFGFTLRRTLELTPPDATVVVAELLPEIISWNREFLTEINGTLLDDPRVTIHQGDVCDLLARASGPDRFHAIMLDVDNSPDPLVQKGNARLYNRRGLEQAKAALHPHGRVVYWSANQDRAFARALERTFAHTQSIPAKAYPKAKRFTHTLFVGDR